METSHAQDRRIIDFRTAVARLRPDAVVCTPRMVDLVEKWECSLIAAGRRPRGIQKYVWTMRKIISYLGGPALTMEALTYRAALEYIETQAGAGRSPSSRINDLAVIRSFARWGIREGLRIDDPTDGIERPKKPIEAPDPLTDDEWTLLMDIVDNLPSDLDKRAAWYWRRNRLCIVLMALTGLRIFEASNLLWRDCNLRTRSITVREGKGGFDGAVPICDELYAELLTIPEEERRDNWAVFAHYGKKRAGQRGTVKMLERVFNRWLKQVGQLSGISAHRLRHTFASELLYNDVDVRRIQRLLRHRYLSSTQRYLLLRDSDLEEAVNTLSLKSRAPKGR